MYITAFTDNSDIMKVTKEMLQLQADDLQTQLNRLQEAIRSLELNDDEVTRSSHDELISALIVKHAKNAVTNEEGFKICQRVRILRDRLDPWSRKVISRERGIEGVVVGTTKKGVWMLFDGKTDSCLKYNQNGTMI